MQQYLAKGRFQLSYSNRYNRNLSLLLLTAFAFLIFFPGAHALAQDSATQDLSAQSLIVEIVETILYSTIGILMGVVGFKVVDWLTPGNLAEEVAHKENRALAILAGSMMLGVCIIIASVLVS